MNAEELYIDALAALEELHDAIVADVPDYLDPDCDRAKGLISKHHQDRFWRVYDALEAARDLYKEGE